MAVHVLIDGYNLIRRSATLRAEDEIALSLGRESLLERLRRYKRARRHRITVIFDGANPLRPEDSGYRQKGIRVIYSGGGENADAVIKRICRADGENLVVVTSDRELAGYVESCGATTIDSAEFEAAMEMALYLESKGGEEEDELGEWPQNSGTRKKGPSRRPSKKERRQRQRLSKL
jgi:predicted RNA-binding protein with PIN domain